MSTNISAITQTQNSAATQSNAVTATGKGAGALTVNDFLKLLTVQLSSQDPLKPMEDTQFISQMANFTSLEQMKNLSENFSAFTKQQALISAQDYLGKTVTVIGGDAGTTTGVVSSVNLKDGAPTVTIGGAAHSISDVIGIALSPTTTNSSSSIH